MGLLVYRVPNRERIEQAAIQTGREGLDVKMKELGILERTRELALGRRLCRWGMRHLHFDSESRCVPTVEILHLSKVFADGRGPALEPLGLGLLARKDERSVTG